MTLTLSAVSSAGIAASADIPRSYVASPDVYRVIAEKDDTRVIAATWKPGQRDNWHSHPSASLYWLTDCEGGRTHFPDGTHVDRSPKAGQAVIQPGEKSHSFENRSDKECRAIFVEKE